MPARGPQFQGELFHGTSQHIKDAVVPAAVHGGVSHWEDTGEHKGQASRDHAFATTSEDTAWHFAQHAARNELSTTNRVRARVYEVTPHPKMRPGVHEELHEYIAPSFKTTGVVHDIKPGQQGTFPEINWNRQAKPGSFGDDHNHPVTNPGHRLSTGTQVGMSNDRASEAQDAAHMRFKARIESIGQTALFSQLDGIHHSDYARAQAHDLRHVVNEGQAPAHEVDHELAHEEALDSFNRRQGRRSAFAKRLKNDRNYGGPSSWKEY